MNVFLYCVMLFCQKVPFPAITAVLDSRWVQWEPMCTVKWGDLDLVLLYFMISYLTATTQPLDTQNMCPHSLD